MGAYFPKAVFSAPKMSIDTTIQGLKPRTAPYKHSIGEGLYILVRPTGQKYWRIKYHFAGRERLYSVGVFPKVSVKAAIAARQYVKDLIQAGTDPSVVKREEAKLKSKPISKNMFRLAVTSKGSLTIETNTKLLTLSPAQTKALQSFLAVNNEGGGETKS